MGFGGVWLVKYLSSVVKVSKSVKSHLVQNFIAASALAHGAATRCFWFHGIVNSSMKAASYSRRCDEELHGR